MKILIIEDEADLRQAIIRYLKREGFRCEEAATFSEGYRQLVKYDYDGILLDLQLPDGDGLRLLRLLRENESPAGILVISARDTTEERVSALDLGADDFLSKPFNLAELNARIKAVLRRKTNQLSPTLQFGELLIDLDAREVRAGEHTIQLTRKEFDILVFLARNKNRVVTKDSIVEYLWGDYLDDAVSYDFIYAHVKNLRKKLSDAGQGERLKTVYGIGYKFVAP